MKQLKILSVLMVFTLSINVNSQDEDKEFPDVLLFEADSLITQLQTQDKRWTAFLRGENVLTGIYHLKAGMQDMQKPHDTDEVYYIIEGKARLIAGGVESMVAKGSIIFVKAEIPHKFVDIQEDLVVLVFFDQ